MNGIIVIDNYEELILNEFDRLPDADIIVFYIKRKEKPKPNYDSLRRMDYFSVLKIFSFATPHSSNLCKTACAGKLE